VALGEAAAVIDLTLFGRRRAQTTRGPAGIIAPVTSYEHPDHLRRRFVSRAGSHRLRGGQRDATPLKEVHIEPPIVVFSHLRWDFVYQRPQQLLSRLAANHRVHFIEEPVRDLDGALRWDRATPVPNVTVWRPHTPLDDAPGFHAEQLPHLARLIAGLAGAEGWSEPVAWLYTPMALPLARQLEPSVLVYDCMDELSLFHGAPPELVEYEVELIQRADVVFTGGRSLYRAKRPSRSNIFCFPSSVDAAHFRRAAGARPPAEEPADQAALPHPRLGFAGVIDERLDRPLLDGAARLRPAWQFVMVGPVAKIDPGTLPRRPNIHYLGRRPYAELPRYLAGWDVCLLPFALNDATRFISPTKTLEYMAAERPIVSTPIADVAEPYGDIVYLARTPAEFVDACEAALAETPAERRQRVDRMRAVLARTSWDATAATMQRLLTRALRRRQTVS
jgi:UDP-galactopyranose mutase